MKLGKKYIYLTAILIIIIFLFSFSYFSKFNFNNILTNYVDTSNENIGETPVSPGTTPSPPGTTPNPPGKTLTFVSYSCSVSGNADTIRFKIKATGFNIGLEQMGVLLDNTGAAFKDSNGNTINRVSLEANSISDEFSYTTTNHKDTRTITVSTPTGPFEQTVPCS